MDALIVAAGRALAAGDVLSALNHVALRDDPAALALRGIAMARLGDLPRARDLLRRAARGFGQHEALARARCVVADAEVALALRDLGGSPRRLDEAIEALESRGDAVNAAHARLIAVRRALWLGRLAEAQAILTAIEPGRLATPTLAALAELLSAELAMRRLDTGAAAGALRRAREAAVRADVPALRAEVDEAAQALTRPAARCIRAGHGTTLRLGEVERLLASPALVVDACRRGVRRGSAWWPLRRRPVLFELALALSEAWPQPVDRDALIARAFRLRDPDETHRARLRVEIGRLRALLAPAVRIEARDRGFVLLPVGTDQVAVLRPPIDGGSAPLLALLADGLPWSTSALALALGDSQRTVQRELSDLMSAGQVRAVGRGRAQRWLSAPLIGFTTILLLPASLPPA